MTHHLKFQELLDLAFGSPEQGALNFRYLHAFLCALLERTETKSTRVELKGGHFISLETLLANEKKPLINVAEYETEKNEATGVHDKKKQIICPEPEPTHLLVLRDIYKEEAATKDDEETKKEQESQQKVDECCNKLKDLEARLQMMEEQMKIIEKRGVQKRKSDSKSNTAPEAEVGEGCEEICSEYEEGDEQAVDDPEKYEQATDESGDDQCESRPPTSSTRSGRASDESSIDLLHYVSQMCADLETLKRELCKTQKCVKKLCEANSIVSNIGEETDIKFDEMMGIVNDAIERIKKNCDRITCLGKAIDLLDNRVQVASEELETLFRVKADKEEVEMHLALKANKTDLDLKVDLDVFECVKSDLSEGILEAHKSIKGLSNRLDHHFSELLSCLGKKLDRESFEAFANCIENRIRILASELQRWIQIKKKEVCPFTTTPYIQNQCCGACRQPVVMRGEESTLPKMPALPTIAWNCKTKALQCRQAGGAHTTTTAKERLCRRHKFIDHFATAKECSEPNSLEANVGSSCMKSDLSTENPE